MRWVSPSALPNLQELCQMGGVFMDVLVISGWFGGYEGVMLKRRREAGWREFYNRGQAESYRPRYSLCRSLPKLKPPLTAT